MRRLLIALVGLLFAIWCLGAGCGDNGDNSGSDIDTDSDSDTDTDSEEQRMCGGLTGARCDETDYCAYDVGDRCGAADAASVCKPRPEICTRDYTPVCGCDGKTYSNKCGAASAGTGIMSEGECP